MTLDKRRGSSFLYSPAGIRDNNTIDGFVCAGTCLDSLRGTRLCGNAISFLHGTRLCGNEMSHFSRDHGIRNTFLFHLSRDHGIMLSPVQSRENCPFEKIPEKVLENVSIDTYCRLQ